MKHFNLPPWPARLVYASLLASSGGCANSGESPCGPGTVLNEDSQCIPVCAAGTVFENGRCRLLTDDASTTSDTRATQADTEPACEAGTRYDNGECVSLCGPRTQFRNGQCVSVCTPGTHYENGQCVDDPTAEDTAPIETTSGDSADTGPAVGADCAALQARLFANIPHDDPNDPVQAQYCDLAGANFVGVTLKYADFTGANLTNARLSNVGYANFTGADLANARMISMGHAVLKNANLTGADLTGAVANKVDLTNADLTNADLTGANLNVADLTGATLTGATLTGVSWMWAICPDGTQVDGAPLTTCEGHLN
jgi:uncharacterized protein YjbI with pentapeptide repeats